MPTMRSQFFLVLSMSFTWEKTISKSTWISTDSATSLGKALKHFKTESRTVSSTLV
ncbi:hypothetical protein CDL12_22017 [Handroanthus impetiginosus]|uniref:Uncharacterized protein n=1 Tax=Handroanthus impetiginosus TaxID=429701 RepID=A0A2G9G4G1_9LAMI|nr:hypothetical protein CDL12_27715 [Handroanthus impetiginosus]PIN05439.1 hypothetical protein CDL12_22017 [Handroanthus impetiginosus]